ncbi:MAG TPA: hypothetical protein VK625_17225 [Flavitalea sp.]|nr:hypothetical protein [Flavitalea sp.]
MKINMIIAFFIFMTISSIEEKETIQLSAEKGTRLGPQIKYMPEWKAFG